MDREQAIKVLKPLVNSYVDHANITMKEEDDNIAEALEMAVESLKALPTIQPVANDTNDGEMQEMKQEFLRMAGYIDVLLNCSDEQKETLLGFISRLSEFMPWTQED